MQNRLRFFKSSEELISMILGLMIVLLAGWLAFNYFQNRNNGDIAVPGITDDQEQVAENMTPTVTSGAVAQATTAPTNAQANQGQQNVTTPGRTYVVNSGDNLWKIAEKEYGSGYNWIDIAKANKLNSPGRIAVGQKLELPGVQKREVTAAAPEDKIEGGEYTVKKGDSLSKIALRAYGDKFAWNRIWEANKSAIRDPNRIYSGTKLTIPRTEQKGAETSLRDGPTK